MENIDKQIQMAEKRLWQLILLAVVVILYLTLMVLVILFSGARGGQAIAFLPSDFPEYSVSLAVLILLFCSYMIMAQRRFLQFSKTFVAERQQRDALARNVSILSSLLEVSSSINSSMQLHEILETITREMLSCFSADHSSIMLLEPRTNMLRTKASYGKGAEYAKDALIPLGKSIAGWVVENSQPLLLNGKVDQKRFPGTERKDRPISSSLCVPLRMSEKSIGVLNVNLLGEERTFSEDDLKLLTVFANNAAVAIHNSMLLKEKDQRVRLQTMLGQLHSPQIVQKLVEKYDEANTPDQMREKVEMTILFSDIRGYTSMLSAMKLEDIMGFLDEFYSIMNKAVFDNEGSIDKFIGDEVMAFFGAPIPLENSGRNGLATAYEMLGYFADLTEKYAARDPFFRNLSLGIGLNTGEVFVGNVGSATRYEYTVIGNAVNLAKRLCAYASANEILTTERTVRCMSTEVRSSYLKKIVFKGIPDPVKVHRIEFPEDLARKMESLSQNLHTNTA
ncbi:MAG: adenylate/guanylate cyclase domain-containing protein [Desulfatibacillaceae bacterium]